LKVVLAGVSTRAAAESAARAGFDVTAIDAFADVDQHPSVRAHSLGNRFSPGAAARHAGSIACDVVAYGSNFENYPDAVSLLAAGRTLWGNPPEVLRRVRDPLLLSQALRRRGFAAPEVSVESGISNPESRSNQDIPWLVKPFASGGGHRVRRWRPGARVPRGCYRQAFVPGTPGSIVFVAAGGRFVTLGVFRQLIGEEAFGVSGYRYCGNILPAEHEDGVFHDARALAGAVCEEFDLVGVNGIDFVAKDGVPYAIEVNPRWCASMELVERRDGLSVFGAHAAACRDRVLPVFDLERARRGADAVGKAIVFARQNVTVGDLRTRLDENVGADRVRDIPHPGTAICAGHPVCTVLASGRDVAECHRELVRRAAAVEASLTGVL
jgi:predicted ATP-grasp superfamily ATP-dependent carboligase